MGGVSTDGGAGADWAPGAVPVAAARFTPERVLAYGVLTADMNPIHVDEDYAARSRFGRPIVHGMLVLAPVWLALQAAFGAASAEAMMAEVRFVSPVFVGTTPSYRISLTEQDAASARYSVEVHTEAGVEAISGALKIKRPALGESA